MKRGGPVRCARAVAVSLALFAPVHGQTGSADPAAATGKLGSIAGAVRDEAGADVEATVTITAQGLQQERLSAPDGTFRFPGLHGGKYIVCARPTGRNAKPQDEPYVDSCL